MFTIYKHEKDISAVGYQKKTITVKEKWNHLNLMHIQYLLGTNHRLPLSHMAKGYTCLEETKESINQFSIGYIINPNFSINKSFKEQVTKFMKIAFGAMTQPHIIKIL